MPPLPKRVDAQKAALQLFRDRGRVQADARRSEFVVVGGVRLMVLAYCASLLWLGEWWVSSPSRWCILADR
eukprot:696114-Hanusia_phi.AAC.1